MKANKTCLVVRVLLTLILFIGVSFFTSQKAYAVEVGEQVVIEELEWDPHYMREKFLPGYDAIVAEALSEMSPEWSDPEKLLYIYNFIVNNSESILEYMGKKLNPYKDVYADSEKYKCEECDSLPNSKSVCGAKAEAFYDFARRAGIEVYIVRGNRSGGCHSWNMAIIDGKQYYIDCSENMGGSFISYSWFLVSYEVITEERTINSIESNEECGDKLTIRNDTDYDDVFWRHSMSYWQGQLDDDFIIWGWDTKRIFSIYKFSHDLKQKELWLQYDLGETCQAHIIKNELFLISDSIICYYDKEKSEFITLLDVADTKFIHTYTDPYPTRDTITYIEYEKEMCEDGINYRASGGVGTKKSLDISQYVGPDIELDKYYTVCNDTGEKFTITATVMDRPDAVLKWESSDPSVAGVDADGNVTTAGYGVAFIKASCKGSVKTCVVIVPKLEANEKEINIDLSNTLEMEMPISVTPKYWFPYTYLYYESSNPFAVEAYMRDGSLIGSGKISFLNPGKAELIVSTPDEKLSASFKVNVTGERSEESDTESENDENVLNDEDVLNDEYIPEGYEDHSGSPMVIEGKPDCTWNYVGGKAYWYEGGIKQGTYYDSKGIIGDGTNRGREIYDPECDSWFWLDSVYDGAKAVGKEVWIPYIYQDEESWDSDRIWDIACESDPGMENLVYSSMKDKSGKWVRYDENGHMCKGWVTIEGALAEAYPDQEGNTYYYDTRTGLMAKGFVEIDGVGIYFDEVTGVFQYWVQ